jgi:hypothetical protein
MRYQIFLLTTLILTISIGLYASTQIFKFFTEKHIVLGAWDQAQSAMIYSSESDENTPSVLGLSVASTQGFLPHAVFVSSQGFLFDKYFEMHNSPLQGYGQNFVEACHKYSTPSDCTLLLAIAKVETDLCKTDISAQQYNCWGWGGSGRNRVIFDSFPEAIDIITGKVKQGYGDRFFEDANNGALRYCGSHCTNYGNYVESEKHRINDFFKSNGHPGLF